MAELPADLSAFDCEICFHSMQRKLYVFEHHPAAYARHQCVVIIILYLDDYSLQYKSDNSLNYDTTSFIPPCIIAAICYNFRRWSKLVGLLLPPLDNYRFGE